MDCTIQKPVLRARLPEPVRFYGSPRRVQQHVVCVADVPMDLAAQETGVGVADAQAGRDNLVTDITRRHRGPVGSRVSHVVAGADQKLRGTQFVGQRDAVGLQVPPVLAGPIKARGIQNYVSPVSAVDGFGAPLARGTADGSGRRRDAHQDRDHQPAHFRKLICRGVRYRAAAPAPARTYGKPPSPLCLCKTIRRSARTKRSAACVPPVSTVWECDRARGQEGKSHSQREIREPVPPESFTTGDKAEAHRKVAASKSGGRGRRSSWN